MGYVDIVMIYIPHINDDVVDARADAPPAIMFSSAGDKRSNMVVTCW